MQVRYVVCQLWSPQTQHSDAVNLPAPENLFKSNHVHPNRNDLHIITREYLLLALALAFQFQFQVVTLYTDAGTTIWSCAVRTFCDNIFTASCAAQVANFSFEFQSLNYQNIFNPADFYRFFLIRLFSMLHLTSIKISRTICESKLIGDLTIELFNLKLGLKLKQPLLMLCSCQRSIYLHFVENNRLFLRDINDQKFNIESYSSSGQAESENPA